MTTQPLDSLNMDSNIPPSSPPQGNPLPMSTSDFRIDDKVQVNRAQPTPRQVRGYVRHVNTDHLHVEYVEEVGRDAFIYRDREWVSLDHPDQQVEVVLLDRPQRWVVVTWIRGNVGGTSLAMYLDEDEFLIATGPTPWGSGSWGPFPRSAVSEVRPLRLDDTWRVNGSLDRRWSAQQLLEAYKRARWGTMRSASGAEKTLEATLKALTAEQPDEP